VCSIALTGNQPWAADSRCCKTGDRLVIDLNTCRCDALVPEDECPTVRVEATRAGKPNPWQEIHRKCTGQLSTGMCLGLCDVAIGMWARSCRGIIIDGL